MEIIQLENVGFTYAQASNPTLKDINLTINKGDFVVLCGPSGCGKSTLLRLIKKELAPSGKQTGTIYYKGEDINNYEYRKLVEQIALVMQDPDYQIVFDEVLQELVFALENLGVHEQEMKKRIAELVHYFEVEDLLQSKPSLLSGGQKQTINLLSALLLKPEVLILDEPTSQLDPIASKKFLTMLKELNDETGMTIIIAEHRLEYLFAMADQMVLLTDGRIQAAGTSRQLIKNIMDSKEVTMKAYIPDIIRFIFLLKREIQWERIPLTLNGCRRIVEDTNFMATHDGQVFDYDQCQPIIDCKNVYVQYEKNSPYILKGFSAEVRGGEVFALLGGNGSGKSTWLKTIIGSVHMVTGKLTIKGKKLSKIPLSELTKLIHYLPQNPKTYFMQETIEKEMQSLIHKNDIEDGQRIIDELLNRYGIEHIRARHPHDCSGGELQRAALACLQIGNPKILLLDEPTKGLDPVSKEQLLTIIDELRKKGGTILIVTHDIEFAAKCATRCGILFDGEITAIGSTKEVLSNNYFYTTSLNRLTKSEEFGGFLTIEEVEQCCEAERLGC